MRAFSYKAATFWLVALVLVTTVLVNVRETLDSAHVALTLLLVVLGASATGGRVVGVGTAIASFLVFNWFFLAPYSTLTVANPLDWLVLVAFLVTGVVASQLLYLARERARAAQLRAEEAERVTALKHDQQLKDALLASISHDLRTPLTTIKALAHDLSVLGDERSEIIEQEADRLTRTVSDLLDLSRLNAGALPLRIEVNAIDDLLGALVQRVEPSLGPGRLRIALPADDPLLVGHFDFVHTLRIVVNLVENAAKYSPASSPIDVSAARRGAELVIEVSDRGPGVPPEEAERVFDEFYRPASTSPDVTGVGLGLSIARRLAHAQKGMLTYRARSGGGSTFLLTLPAADLNAPESGVAAAS